MDSTLLIIVALVALAAIIWIALTVMRSGRPQTGAPNGPVTTAYERELADSASADARGGGVPAGRTDARTDAGAEHLRTTAAAGGSIHGTPIAPSTGPLSTAYEAELANSGVRQTPPPTAPDAPEHTGNLRTDVRAADGTVAPPPAYVNAATAQAGLGPAGTIAGVTAGVTAGLSEGVNAAADAARAATEELVAADPADEIVQRRARAAQVERDLEAARAMGDNLAEESGAPPRRDDDAAEEFIETPLPDPAPADAAAATGGLGAVTLDEPEEARHPHEGDDDRPTPGTLT